MFGGAGAGGEGSTKPGPGKNQRNGLQRILDELPVPGNYESEFIPSNHGTTFVRKNW